MTISIPHEADATIEQRFAFCGAQETLEHIETFSKELAEQERATLEWTYAKIVRDSDILTLHGRLRREDGSEIQVHVLAPGLAYRFGPASGELAQLILSLAGR